MLLNFYTKPEPHGPNVRVPRKEKNKETVFWTKRNPSIELSV